MNDEGSDDGGGDGTGEEERRLSFLDYYGVPKDDDVDGHEDTSVAVQAEKTEGSAEELPAAETVSGTAYS